MKPLSDPGVVVGRDHMAAHAALTSAWDQVIGGRGERRLVVVKAAPGLGATTRLRGLYEHCAASLRGYWPSALPDRSAASREALYPARFTPGDRLNYFWWGLSAAPGHNAVLDGQGQLDVHLAALGQALEQARQSLPLSTKLRRGWDATNVGLAVAALFAGLALPLQVGVTAIEAILLASDVLGVRAKGPTTAAALSSHRSKEVNIGATAGLDGLFETSRALLTGAMQLIPLAIVVDQAEHLDPRSARLLVELLEQATGRALVVLAVDETHPRLDRPDLTGLGPLIDWADRHGLPGGWWTDREPAEGVDTAAAGCRLSPLKPEELAALAVAQPDSRGPVNPVVLSRVVAAAAGSPAGLTTILSRPAVAQALRDPQAPDPGRLEPAGDRLGTQVRALPDAVARPLAVAALLGAVTRMDWFKEACDMAGIDPAGLARGDWVSQHDGVLRFVTPAAHQAVLDRAFDDEAPWLLTDHERQRVQAELVYHIEQGYGSDFADLAADVRFEALRAVVDERWNQRPAQINQWTADYLTLAAVDRSLAAETLPQLIKDRLAHPPAWLLARTTEALLEVGLAARAADLWRAEAERVDRATRRPGSAVPGAQASVSPYTLTVFGNLAAVLGQQARQLRRTLPDAASEVYHQAVEEYRQLIERYPAPIGLSQLLAEQNLMVLQADFNRLEDAITTGQTLVDHLTHHADFGWQHGLTLTARNNIANWTGQAGRPEEALRLFQALLSDQEHVLGPTHRDTLVIRNNIAHWTGEAGQHKQALKLFQGLLPDREQVLGPTHPDTLTTRGNIASWTGGLGHPKKALELFQALLPDQEHVLGPTHPDTLTTRGHIAELTGETGHPKKALKLFQALLPDRERVLGPTHPDTLRARSNIAHWTGEAGRPEEALRQFQALLSDLEQAVGPNHPDTLTTRKLIDLLTGGDGHPEKVFKRPKESFHDLVQ
ncbi:MAG: tetratricopeptide repeat protein [Propionibacteriaceae bacterium]|jgi:hypothetical protein|nr:tetratricopeptide repeat protein [Propionibacteriaceae bacterium]